MKYETEHHCKQTYQVGLILFLYLNETIFIKSVMFLIIE